MNDSNITNRRQRLNTSATLLAERHVRIARRAAAWAQPGYLSESTLKVAPAKRQRAA